MITVTYILGKNSIQGQEEMQDKQILLESLMHIHFANKIECYGGGW